MGFTYILPTPGWLENDSNSRRKGLTRTTAMSLSIHRKVHSGLVGNNVSLQLDALENMPVTLAPQVPINIYCYCSLPLCVRMLTLVDILPAFSTTLLPILPLRYQILLCLHGYFSASYYKISQAHHSLATAK